MDDKDKIMDMLWELFIKLDSSSGKRHSSMIEKYAYFIEHSKQGRACTYAQKSKVLFYRNDFPEIKEAILKLADKIKDQ